MTEQYHHRGTSIQAREIAAGLSLLSVQAEARLISVVPARSMETRRYWDIASVYLRDMYQALHPGKAPAPQTASPPDFAWAIEMDFGTNLDNRQGGAGLSLHRGTKRKRADADQGEEFRLRRQRLETTDKGSTSEASGPSPIPSPEWASFPQPTITEDELADDRIDGGGQGVPEDSAALSDEEDENDSQKTYDEGHDCGDSEGRNESKNGCVVSDGLGDCGTTLARQNMHNALFVGQPEANAGADFDQLLNATTEYSDLLSEWPSSLSVNDSWPQVFSARSTPASPPEEPLHVENHINPMLVFQELPLFSDDIQSPYAATAQHLPIDELVNSWRIPENLERAIEETFPCTVPLEPSAAPIEDAPQIGPSQNNPDRDPAFEPDGIHKLRNTILQQFQDRVHIPLYGQVLTLSDVERLLDELENTRPITKSTEQLAQNGGLPQNPIPETLLLPTWTQGQWSLVEIDIVKSSVVHHLFTAARAYSEEAPVTAH
ncbi:hypothetical protein FE257_004935 [Aspergillus nanangensis]|uniref:Uncharacterized protein n=1 Tax=Aspergillus nanangensis TaxID=2582783 RepID=A0AAD4CAU6_ASPNN|nr:hypothetical protein FE257_004935 [Aspergillus nanangensis]